MRIRFCASKGEGRAWVEVNAVMHLMAYCTVQDTSRVIVLTADRSSSLPLAMPLSIVRSHHPSMSTASAVSCHSARPCDRHPTIAS
nr:hypothetical protein CFP56_46646 [Quercus suber]